MDGVEVIDWIDSAGTGQTWLDAEAVQDLRPVEFQTIGKVVSETDVYLTMAASWEMNKETAQMGGVIVIPKCAVLKRRKVK